ncbi:endonuclease/exonuclease/phosphatase family protein [Salinarimonas rosea]|uniref:endonuclease/exonuclease/phosphatase family protein n=1 Tax=Salinarimonas rosea TaxID=552063 RepID=UPI000410722A|nr:endonuclease/exonuclease/phosphatase family protein [Salinarimonas rosea]
MPEPASSPRAGRRGIVATWIVLPLLLLAAGASLLPLVETNAWWIRSLDFARVQLLIALAILVLLYPVVAPRRGAVVWAGVVLGLAGAGYHLYRLHPYASFMDEAMIAGTCTPDRRLRIMIANVQESHEEPGPFLDLVADTAPDVLLVMETDAFWDDALQPLDMRFPHRVQSIPEDAAFGMHAFSHRPFVEPRFVDLFGSGTPTLTTGLALASGETVQFYGMHPRPPLAWSQPTTMRDAHLLSVALEVHDGEAPAILAGDFNAVPWERTMRRALRIGGLLDPRVGRGWRPTFMTGSLLVSWPLDQVLAQDGFTLAELEVLPDFGSDHYPVLADLCRDPGAGARQAAPALEQGDLEEARTAIEAARALRGESGS